MTTPRKKPMQEQFEEEISIHGSAFMKDGELIKNEDMFIIPIQQIDAEVRYNIIIAVPEICTFKNDSGKLEYSIRPITLPDVLIAMQKLKKPEIVNIFIESDGELMIEYNGDDFPHWSGHRWNLSLSYEDQEESVKRFIHLVIVK